MFGRTRDIAGSEVTEGLMADYGGLLHESAYLLAAVAEAEPADRVDELEALLAVESESANTYFELVRQVSSPKGFEAPEARESVRQLVSCVHSLFGVLVRIGATLVACDSREMPGLLIENARLVESVSKALARALESQQDPAEIERCVWAVQWGVEAMDRNLAELSQSVSAPSDK